MTEKRAARDTYLYKLRKGRKIVKHGKTNNPDRRMVEMDNQGLDYDTMSIDPHPMSEPTARKRESERIKSHKKSHGGRRPKYNRAD